MLEKKPSGVYEREKVKQSVAKEEEKKHGKISKKKKPGKFELPTFAEDPVLVEYARELTTKILQEVHEAFIREIAE